MKKLISLSAFILLSACDTPAPLYPFDWNIEHLNACGDIHNRYIDVEVDRWMKSDYETTDVNMGKLYRELIVKVWMKREFFVPFDRWCRDNLTREQYYCIIYTKTFGEMNSCFPNERQVKWQ